MPVTINDAQPQFSSGPFRCVQATLSSRPSRSSKARPLYAMSSEPTRLAKVVIQKRYSSTPAKPPMRKTAIGSSQPGAMACVKPSAATPPAAKSKIRTRDRANAPAEIASSRPATNGCMPYCLPWARPSNPAANVTLIASQKRCVRPPSIHRRTPIASPVPLMKGERKRASSRMSGASNCMRQAPSKRRPLADPWMSPFCLNGGKLTRAGNPVKVARVRGCIARRARRAVFPSREHQRAAHSRSRLGNRRYIICKEKIRRCACG